MRELKPSTADGVRAVNGAIRVLHVITRLIPRGDNGGAAEGALDFAREHRMRARIGEAGRAVIA
jgi:hypothetical protein